jgi:hypothetical protein
MDETEAMVESEVFMWVITGLVVTALAIVSVFLTAQKTDPSQLLEPRVGLPALGVQIVCGDCSGDGVSPRRTYLNRLGNCSECGGHSYVLASNLYRPAQVSRRSPDANAVRGRLLPFKVERSEKIAV